MTEQNILSDIQQHGGCMEYVALLNYERQKHKTSAETTRLLLKYLLSQKYLSGKIEAFGTIRLEPKGAAYLDALTQTQIDRKKQFSHDWKIALWGTLGGALLSEPLWSIIEWVLTFLSDHTTP